MTKRRGQRYSGIALVLLGLAALTACGGAGADQPTVAITSPAAGSTVALNEQLSVQLSANDPDGPGVVRLELQVGGGHTEVFEAGGPQPSLTTSMMCTPSEEGPTTLTAIAYRADGTASSPATISLTVASGSGAQEAASEGESTSGAEEEAPSAQAQANLTTNVRAGPMPDCQIVGSVNQDQVIPVSAVTDRSVDNWYRVEEPLGWIWEGNLTLLDDASSLPRLNVTSCEAAGVVAGSGTGAGDTGTSGGAVTTVCGDGTCSGGETCETCEDDCGACVPEPVCGDGTCSPDAGEDCETCEDDCGACVTEPVCGDGTCSAEAGETCDFCPDDCNYGNPFMGCCGDGTCSEELGEDCVTCQTDCLCGPASFAQCGDGLCTEHAGEDCETCWRDCGLCESTVCGDGICGAEETNMNCEQDCPDPAYDGFCEGYDEWLWGPADGDCIGWTSSDG